MADDEMQSPLTQLPAELIQTILSFLPATALATLAQTCHLLHDHTFNEQLWKARVQENLPATTLDKACPASSFRQLYINFRPYLHLPKYKIWFSDSPHTGMLLVARYSHSRRTIEAYQLAAERGATGFEWWSWNQEVIIHTFEPNVCLDLNFPIIKLVPSAIENVFGNLEQEIPMDNRTGGVSSAYLHSRSLPPNAIGPGTQVWPPQTLPAVSRTRNASMEAFRGLGHRPSKFSELSESTFRLRRWMDYTSQLAGVRRVGENVNTFATLPLECYTPIKSKPWRGIWVGDYSGHGCEFMVVLQPDVPQRLPENVADAIEHNRRSVSPASDRSDRSDTSYHTAASALDSVAPSLGGPEFRSFVQSQIVDSHPTATERASKMAVADQDDDEEFSGQLMAVKLTGDANIPRGEYTFIAPDISSRGLIRIASEDIFKGARIVRSVGHIAARGYREDAYIPSQLILINHDTIAQYWEAFGHISFYKRVDIDQFLHAD